MTDTIDPSIGILICLTSLEDDIADHSALQLAKLFGSTCRALLIEDQSAAIAQNARAGGKQIMARRQRRLAFLGQEMGLSVDVDVASLSPGVERLQSQPGQATTILMQPVHPLSRQTHLFRSLQRAAASAAAATVYSPPTHNLEGGDVLVLTGSRDSGGVAIAKDLASKTRRAFEIYHVAPQPSPTVSSIVKDLALRMSLDAPSLIVMTEDELLSQPSQFSSLAARLETPVLVVSAGQTSTRPAA